jgi:uncharacterized membrane protein YfcA
MELEWWKLLVFAVASVVMSIFSGIAGAGGGFVMTPLLIFLGLTPAQAVSTGKIGGLMITLGSLGSMRSVTRKLTWHKIVPIMLLALAVGLVVPYAIRSLDNDVYRIVLGIILLLMVPIMLIRKVGIEPKKPSRSKAYLGYVLLTGALALQGMFSGGLGTLVNVVLMGMLGMTATEANVTKRWSQLILNITILFGVVLSGLIVWQIAAVMIFTTFIGGAIGGHLAVKKGDKFVLNVMIGLTVISGLLLIFGV